MKIIITSGYFDPLHVGHIELLKLAKAFGDKLVVILNSDEQCILKKGKPFMPQEERRIIVESLKFVDEVLLSVDKDKTCIESIKAIAKKYNRSPQKMTFARFEITRGSAKIENLQDWFFCVDERIIPEWLSPAHDQAARAVFEAYLAEQLVAGIYPGDLDLTGYAHPLPAGLTTTSNLVDLGDYAHPLPAGMTTTGGLDLRGYAHPLPAGLTTTGGLDLRGYAHPLPAGLTTTGNLYGLGDYTHPLPAGLTTTGYLDLSGYAHPLPAGLKRR